MILEWQFIYLLKEAQRISHIKKKKKYIKQAKCERHHKDIRFTKEKKEKNIYKLYLFYYYLKHNLFGAPPIVFVHLQHI